ncbi:MAG: hypothetical protein K8T25_02295 [Planctomycetia bacterium]|nr:hypothetical protein [Planctomycetia bacterium]
MEPLRGGPKRALLGKPAVAPGAEPAEDWLVYRNANSSKEEDEMKNFRPRFSIRTLFVVTTVVGVYFGLLEATKRMGVEDVKNHLTQEDQWVENEDIFVKAPLIVEAGGYVHIGGLDAPLSSLTWQRQYYFWFFGYVTLAYER